jgi:elongation factor Ts
MEAEGIIGSYVHNNRIGVLVNLNVSDAVLAKDIAMHIAASKPLVIKAADVPQNVIDREKEIYLAQVKDSGKPAEIMEKMVKGKLQKFVDELSLLNQPFVKDPNVKIADLLKVAKAEVIAFERFEVGEGIEKEKCDFADEVKKVIGN